MIKTNIITKDVKRQTENVTHLIQWCSMVFEAKDLLGVAQGMGLALGFDELYEL